MVLLVAVILVILLALLLSDLGTTYEAERAKALAAEGCVTDASWRKLPAELYAKSSMSSELTGVKWFLSLLVIGTVVGLVVLLYAFNALGKLRKRALY